MLMYVTRIHICNNAVMGYLKRKILALYRINRKNYKTYRNLKYRVTPNSILCYSYRAYSCIQYVSQQMHFNRIQKIKTKNKLRDKCQTPASFGVLRMAFLNY
jgi:hypothetical protein